MMKTGTHLGDDSNILYPCVAHGTVGKRHSTITRELRKKLREELPLEEVKALSLEKAPNGCATSLALEAQKALYWRRTCRGQM